MALRLLWGAPIMYSPYEMPHNINYLNPLTLYSTLYVEAFRYDSQGFW